MKRLLFSGLVCCTLAMGDFTPQAWRLRRPLTVKPGATVSEFTLDAPLYHDSAANLDDLRILRGAAETPYTIETLSGSRQAVTEAGTISNKEWVPGVGVQAVLDLKSHAEHNRLIIRSPLHNFKESVRVETSDDGHVWAVAEASGVIFDIQRDDLAVNDTTVTYPASTRRYVRLTIPGWTDAANLQSAAVAEFKETGATRDVVAQLTPTVREDMQAQTSELMVDLDFPGRPFDQITLTVDPGLFSRSVEVLTSNDLMHWDFTAGGIILRTADEEHLKIDIAERSERYLKIVVFNADSAALHFGSVTVSGVRRVVKFSSAQPGPYFVYLANPSARRSSYDFARVIPAKTTAASAEVGAVEQNPAFRLPDRPWTDRNPWLLNGALIIAVCAMGFVTLRMIKKTA